MLAVPTLANLRITAQTIAIGAIGAGLAELLNAPIAVLTGPALFVSVLALAGVRTGIDNTIRDLVFLLVGIGIGSGVDTSATAAMIRWPLAFMALAVMLWFTLLLCAQILQRGFGMDRRSAYLAAAPGHMSFVMGISAALNLDTTRIVVIQLVRLLALTLSVPVIALAFGYQIPDRVFPQGDTIQLANLALLLLAGYLLGYAFHRFGLPAPLLIGGMVVSSFGHGSGFTPGVLNPWLAYLGLMTVGTLIGARFDGITRQALLASLLAGLTVTVATTMMALATAIPVAYALGFEPTHVIIAFAPGGLETMIAMGVVLGANAGFVAASHVARLLVLTALIPAFIGRIKRD